jgi:hypothetical protein
MKNWRFIATNCCLLVIRRMAKLQKYNHWLYRCIVSYWYRDKKIYRLSLSHLKNIVPTPRQAYCKCTRDCSGGTQLAVTVELMSAKHYGHVHATLHTLIVPLFPRALPHVSYYCSCYACPISYDLSGYFCFLTKYTVVFFAASIGHLIPTKNFQSVSMW